MVLLFQQPAKNRTRPVKLFSRMHNERGRTRRTADASAIVRASGAPPLMISRALRSAFADSVLCFASRRTEEEKYRPVDGSACFT